MSCYQLKTAPVYYYFAVSSHFLSIIGSSSRDATIDRIKYLLDLNDLFAFGSPYEPYKMYNAKHYRMKWIDARWNRNPTKNIRKIF